MPTATAKYYSLEEYFEREEKSPLRHEYYEGEIFTMSGGSPSHVSISLNIGAELRLALRGREGIAYGNDMRVVSPTGLLTYPDATAVRSKPEFVTHSGLKTLTNPTLITDVLSPSTEAYDRGKKFENYKPIPALKNHLFVAQDKPRVELFTRQTSEQWDLTIVEGLDAEILLPELDITLALAEIYEKVEFSAS